MIDEESVRRERLQKLRDAGTDPYTAKVNRDTMIAEALLNFDEWSESHKALTVAGRLRAVRGHGGAAFADLEDVSERIQLHIKSDVVGEESFTNFTDTIDIADFVEVTGTLFLTKRGQKTLEVQSWRLLSKTLLPLPDKWHGLNDVEIRYRKRYLDLISNPEARDIFKKRSLIVKTIRDFLDARDFMEVETPILQTLAGGASAKPFVTHHNALDIDLFLRVAPELYLKRLIVGGFEKVYEIARCFRNEGVSWQHNPEFTQVEFYWAYANYEDLMNLTEELVSELVKKVTGGETKIERDGVELDFSAPFPRLKFYDIVKDKTGIDLDEADTEEKLHAAIKEKGLKLDEATIVGYGALADELYKKYVRPSIIQPSFLIDYPAEMIPLAKRKFDEPSRIATMQLLVQGMEVCKAYNELNDPIDQENRFREEEAKRGKGSEDAMETDADFVEALKHGMPPTAGFGMGIDRLAILLTGAPNIKEVILFPTMKPVDVNDDPSAPAALHDPDDSSS